MEQMDMTFGAVTPTLCVGGLHPAAWDPVWGGTSGRGNPIKRNQQVSGRGSALCRYFFVKGKLFSDHSELARVSD